MVVIIPGFARTGTSVLFKCLEKSGFNGGDNLFGHKYKTQDVFLNNVRQIANKYKNSDAEMEFNVSGFWEYVDKHDITLLKDPELWTVLPMFLRDSYRFRIAWIIWMTRDKGEVIESVMRLQKEKDIPPVELNGEITEEAIGEKYDGFLKTMNHLIPRTRSLVIDHSELFNNLSDVRVRLWEFLKRDVDLSLVDKSETFAATGRAQ